MKILNKKYSLLLLTSLFLMGCSDLMYDTFLVYPFKKGELVRKELASYTIDGENYLYIEEEVIRKGVANEKIDRLDYSLVNTRTNKKTTMPNDLYILTKKGLVKANFSIDDTFDYIASKRPIMYNGSFYILSMHQYFSDSDKIKKDKITDCKVAFETHKQYDDLI